jgi:hypothetical protein
MMATEWEAAGLAVISGALVVVAKGAFYPRRWQPVVRVKPGTLSAAVKTPALG